MLCLCILAITAPHSNAKSQPQWKVCFLKYCPAKSTQENCMENLCVFKGTNLHNCAENLMKLNSVFRINTLHNEIIAFSYKITRAHIHRSTSKYKVCNPGAAKPNVNYAFGHQMVDLRSRAYA